MLNTGPTDSQRLQEVLEGLCTAIEGLHKATQGLQRLIASANEQPATRQDAAVTHRLVDGEPHAGKRRAGRTDPPPHRRSAVGLTADLEPCGHCGDGAELSRQAGATGEADTWMNTASWP